MALLTTLGLITGAAGSIKGFIEGGAMKRNAERGLAQFQEQELTNLAENLKPSLEAERQAIASADRARATFESVGSTMDAASAMALLGQGQQQVAGQEQKAFASMLDKEFQADTVRVQEEQSMRGIVENRNREEKATLRAQAQAGAQMQASAIQDIGTTLVSAGLSKELSAAEAGITDPTATMAAKAARRRGASLGEIQEAYRNSGSMGVKDLNRGQNNESFFGGGGAFFKGIGGFIKGLF